VYRLQQLLFIYCLYVCVDVYAAFQANKVVYNSVVRRQSRMNERRHCAWTQCCVECRSWQDFHLSRVIMNRATLPSEVVSIIETAPQKVAPASRKYIENVKRWSWKHRTGQTVERTNGQIFTLSHSCRCNLRTTRPKQLFGITVAGRLYYDIESRKIMNGCSYSLK